MITTYFKRGFALLVFFFAILIKPVYSQEFNSDNTVQRPGFMFGFGLGINEYGLGFGVENFFSDEFSLNANAGIGGWGWKLGGSLNFYPKGAGSHPEFSIGYSYASGLKNFETKLTIEPTNSSRLVNLDLNSVGTINVLYTYNIRVGRASKFAFSAGYAIALNQDAYTVKDNVVLDQTSRTVLDITQPGGFIFGIKLMIGAL